MNIIGFQSCGSAEAGQAIIPLNSKLYYDEKSSSDYFIGGIVNGQNMFCTQTNVIEDFKPH
jgi:hypothetical protein